MKQNQYLLIAFLLTAFSSAVISPAISQQAPEGRKWAIENPKYVELTSAGVHILARDTNEGHSSVTTALHLPIGKPWKVSFDVQMGPTLLCAMSVHLLQGKTDIAWMGADDYYHAMSAFLSTGNTNMPFTQPWDTEWHSFAYVSDGKTLSLWHNGSKCGEALLTGTPDSLEIGSTSLELHVRNLLIDGQIFAMGDSTLIGNKDANIPKPITPSLSIVPLVMVKQASSKFVSTPNNISESLANAFSPLPHVATVIAIQENDANLFCVLGDTIHMVGTTSGQHRLTRRTLEINNQVYIDHPANSSEDGYNFDWTPKGPGIYQLVVNFSLQNPTAVLSVKSIIVNVVPSVPLALQQFSKPLPCSCPVSVRSVDSTFHPARVEFFLNGASIGIAQQEPFQVTLPLSKQLPGSYTVSYQAYDAQGARLSGESETIEVPLRVQLTMPSSLTLVKAKDTTLFTSNIVPGLKIIKVSYYLDDQIAASTTLPPYNASADLSSFKSATYALRADVLIQDGESFCNPPATLALTNQPDDLRHARLAKEEADRQARLLKAEVDKQAQIAKQVADAANKKILTENIAKRNEEKYEQDVADNTLIAVTNNQISVALDGSLTKIGDSFWLTLRITNRNNKAVGPIDPDMHFDDFSSSVLLPYDNTIPQPFDENGYPSKILSDRYHDLVVPANSTKIISYFIPNLTDSDKSRKPARVGFMGTLRTISLLVSP